MTDDQAHVAESTAPPADAKDVSIVAVELGVAVRAILRAADANRIKSWIIEEPGASSRAQPTRRKMVSVAEARDWFNRTPEARKTENRSHQYHVVYWVQSESLESGGLAGFIRANAEAVLVKAEFIVQLRESDAAEIEQIGARQIERTYGVRGFSFRRLGT